MAVAACRARSAPASARTSSWRCCWCTNTTRWEYNLSRTAESHAALAACWVFCKSRMRLQSRQALDLHMEASKHRGGQVLLIAHNECKHLSALKSASARDSSNLYGQTYFARSIESAPASGRTISAVAVKRGLRSSKAALPPIAELQYRTAWGPSLAYSWASNRASDSRSEQITPGGKRDKNEAGLLTLALKIIRLYHIHRHIFIRLSSTSQDILFHLAKKTKCCMLYTVSYTTQRAKFTAI